MQYLLFAPEEKLHSSDENDRQSSEEDEDLVAIFVLRGVVCWEEYHCRLLAKLTQSRARIGRTWNPENPGI